ncbi:MAG: ATP-binding protein [Myxococcota bacterium]
MLGLDFVNRRAELAELDAAARKGGLGVLFGRRRVGKSRLLVHWLNRNGGLYSQAIEAPEDLQVQQVFQDLRPGLTTELAPKSWAELLELLRVEKRRWVVCLDEFPYLVASNPSLPSILQRWVDHSMPKGCTLILAGSSLRMMHGLFLDRSAPLFGRAQKLLHLRPMSYAAFCGALRLDPGKPDSFSKFALVGGVPKYWELLEGKSSPVEAAESLYFELASYLEQEPKRLLRDEGITGVAALGVLEAVGRGAERPSEIASRLGVPQTHLSRLFQQLLDASVLVRDLPFGESLRSTKKVLYRIEDPSLRFWFRVFSPHRSLWRTYSVEQKQALLAEHTSTVFEDYWREQHPGAQRYWEPQLELDLVAPDPKEPRMLLVGEVKWRRLHADERRRLLADLERRWVRSSLAAKHPRVRLEVFDVTSLRRPRA